MFLLLVFTAVLHYTAMLCSLLAIRNTQEILYVALNMNLCRNLLNYSTYAGLHMHTVNPHCINMLMASRCRSLTASHILNADSTIIFPLRRNVKMSNWYFYEKENTKGFLRKVGIFKGEDIVNEFCLKIFIRIYFLCVCFFFDRQTKVRCD